MCRSICRRRAAILRAVDHVDLTVGAGRTLGIVGESGCGKTMLSRAILQLLPKKAKLSGRVMFDGQDLVRLDRERLRKLRGRSLAVVFQDPMTSLNPVLTIGTQLIETLQEHLELDGAAAKMRSVELLAAVGIPAPEQRLMQYPHQLSGGMRQRVAIAIALSCEPKLLIADEPTTALDVTIQAQILDLLAREQRRRHMAMIIITHDLGVVAGRTDEVAVMYAGRVVERAPTPELFKKMRMPYTEALLAAIPKIDAEPHTPLPAISGRPPDPTRPLKGCSFSPRCRYAWAQCQSRSRGSSRRNRRGTNMPASIRSTPPPASPHDAAVSQSVSSDPLLRVENLVVEYPVGNKTVHAVSGVSLEIARGETLGLVGESGCGKSTLGRAVLQLRRPVSGKVLFDGQDLTAMQGDTLRRMRRRVQLIFQDPIASLNPRRRIGDIIAEPLVISGVKDPKKREQLVHDVLGAVGLDPAAGDRTVAARIFRRPMPAHLHCARAGAQSRIHHLRRAGVGARRFDPRPDPQSAGGDEGALRPDAAVHRPRSRGREGGQRPRRRDVSRPALRGRSIRAIVRAAGASLYRAADRGDPGARSGCAAGRKRGGGRAAVADRAALRLPLSHPLPARGPALPRRNAGASRGGARPSSPPAIIH